MKFFTIDFKEKLLKIYYTSGFHHCRELIEGKEYPVIITDEVQTFCEQSALCHIGLVKEESKSKYPEIEESFEANIE